MSRPGLTFFVVSSLLGFLAFVPGMPQLATNPDMSLWLTFHEAFARHLQYGRDLVLTYGPWSILQAGYDARTWPTVLSVSLLFALVFGWTATAMARTLSVATLPALLAVATTASLLASIADVRFLSMPLLLMIWNLVEPEPSRWLARAPLVAAVGLIALVKGSYFVVACLVVGAMSLRLCTMTTKLAGVFAASMTVAWIAAGQSLWNFPRFCLGLLWIMSGYAAAAGVPCPDAAALITASLASAGALVYAAMAEGRRAGVVGIASLGGVLFLLMKNSFIRYDVQHATVAVNLILIVLVVFFGGTLGLHRGRMARAAAAAVVVLELVVLTANGDLLIDALRASTVQAARVSRERARYLTEAGRLSDARELPILNGSVDAYQWGNDVLLTRGMHYAPRPVFQSYMAWTPALARMNLDHIRSHPPDWIVMHVETIDGRFEALDDGPSWPEILSRYDARRFTHDRLILARRAAPIPWHFEHVAQLETPLGAIVRVPVTDEPLWCVVDIRRTTVGHLRNVLLRPSRITMQYVTDRQTSSALVVPAMMQQGFLLSPAVRDTTEFASLMTNRLVPPEQRVRALRFLPEYRGDFDTKVTIQFHRLVSGPGDQAGKW